MKLLLLSQGKLVGDHPGWDYGFKKLVEDGDLSDYFNIPYLGAAKQFGWEKFFENTIKIAMSYKPEIIILQYYHCSQNPDPSPFLNNLKKLPTEPVIVTTCGDGFGKYFHKTPISFVKATVSSDISFFTGMSHIADRSYQYGAKAIALMPNGICNNRFMKEPVKPWRERELDIVFVGSMYGARNPFTHLFRAAHKRKSMVDLLTQIYKERFHLYGNCWEGNPCWKGPLPFNEQGHLYNNSKILVDSYPGVFANYYTSNRLFFGMGEGVIVLTYKMPGLEALFEDSKHLFFYKNIEDIIDTIDRIFKTGSEEIQMMSTNAAQLVRSKHTTYHRCKEIVRICSEYKKNIVKGLKPQISRLDYFLDTIDINKEKERALIGW